MFYSGVCHDIFLTIYRSQVKLYIARSVPPSHRLTHRVVDLEGRDADEALTHRVVDLEGRDGDEALRRRVVDREGRDADEALTHRVLDPEGRDADEALFRGFPEGSRPTRSLKLIAKMCGGSTHVASLEGSPTLVPSDEGILATA